MPLAPMSRGARRTLLSAGTPAGSPELITAVIVALPAEAAAMLAEPDRPLLIVANDAVAGALPAASDCVDDEGGPGLTVGTGVAVGTGVVTGGSGPPPGAGLLPPPPPHAATVTHEKTTAIETPRRKKRIRACSRSTSGPALAHRAFRTSARDQPLRRVPGVRSAAAVSRRRGRGLLCTAASRSTVEFPGGRRATGFPRLPLHDRPRRV